MGDNGARDPFEVIARQGCYSTAYWILLFIVCFWRQMLKINKVQVWLHKVFGRTAAAMVQWHTIFLMGSGLIILVTFHEYCTSYLFISPDTKKEKLQAIWNSSVNRGFQHEFAQMSWVNHTLKYNPNQTLEDVFVDKLLVPGWLHVLNAISMVCAGVSWILVCAHVHHLIAKPLKNLALNHESWRHICWAPTRRSNWLLLIILLPVAFSVAAMRANCRIWTLLMGLAEDLEQKPFKVVQQTIYSQYFTDLEMAAIFQFCCVWSFARITGAVLSDTPLLHQPKPPRPGEMQGIEEEDDDPDAFLPSYRRSDEAEFLLENDSETTRRSSSSKLEAHEVADDYKVTILYAGFLGVWAFVVTGVVRLLVDLAFLVFKSKDRFEDFSEGVYNDIYAKMSSWFVLMAILCIVNMVIICQSPIVKEKLGEANSKFMGTRILLIVFDVQQKVLDCFVYGSQMYASINTVEDHWEKQLPELYVNIHNLDHSDELCKLKNATLLNFWVLLVVIFNLVTWWGMDLEDAGFAKFKKLYVPSDTNVEEPPKFSEAQGADAKLAVIKGKVKTGIRHTKTLFHKEVDNKHDNDPWDF